MQFGRDLAILLCNAQSISFCFFPDAVLIQCTVRHLDGASVIRQSELNAPKKTDQQQTRLRAQLRSSQTHQTNQSINHCQRRHRAMRYGNAFGRVCVSVSMWMITVQCSPNKQTHWPKVTMNGHENNILRIRLRRWRGLAIGRTSD